MARFVVETALRPCLVNGEKALFHMWEQYSNIISPSCMVGGHNGGEVKFIRGIVENEKGEIVIVNPTEIQFTDNKLQEYCFNMPAGSSPEEV